MLILKDIAVPVAGGSHKNSRVNEPETASPAPSGFRRCSRFVRNTFRRGLFVEFEMTDR